MINAFQKGTKLQPHDALHTTKMHRPEKLCTIRGEHRKSPSHIQSPLSFDQASVGKVWKIPMRPLRPRSPPPFKDHLIFSPTQPDR